MPSIYLSILHKSNPSTESLCLLLDGCFREMKLFWSLLNKTDSLQSWIILWEMIVICELRRESLAWHNNQLSTFLHVAAVCWLFRTQTESLKPRQKTAVAGLAAVFIHRIHSPLFCRWLQCCIQHDCLTDLLCRACSSSTSHTAQPQ